MHLQNTRQLPCEAQCTQHLQNWRPLHVDGPHHAPLRRGQFTFELEAGPEYLTQTGHFEIERHADDSKRIEMKRVTDLAKEGWYGGDLDVHRKKTDLPLIPAGRKALQVRTQRLDA